jgi:alpha,alpha-trehalose phosphorylase
VYVPYDEPLGIHPQAEGFTRYAPWDFTASRDQKPLMLHAPYFQLYCRQVVKQADLVLAMHWCPESFTAEQKARNVDYYERITVRDSSLSACTQSVMCAEVGHPELAHDYAREAALIDLRDLHGPSAAAAHRHHPADLPDPAQRTAPARRRRPRDGPAASARRFRCPVGGAAVRRAGRRRPDEPVVRAVAALEPLLPAPRQPAGVLPTRGIAAVRTSSVTRCEARP